MSENQLKSFEAIEQLEAEKELLFYKIEMISKMLDGTHYEGFCDTLSANEWKFYYNEYKDLF